MSASESAFSDAEEELSQRAGPSERKRQRSVEEMFKSAEGKRKRVVSPKHSEKVSKNQRHDFLDEIKRQIDSSIKEAVESLSEKIFIKLASVENKMDKLEGQLFERDQHIDDLTNRCCAFEEKVKELEGQVEEMERHSRSANLVLWCEQFGQRKDGEKIEDVTIKILNENFPNNSVCKGDFAAIHRLPRENTVICTFVNKSLRNEIYEGRFGLRRGEVIGEGRIFVL